MNQWHRMMAPEEWHCAKIEVRCPPRRDRNSQWPVSPPWNQRWAHPGQQQGRRFPALRLEQPHSIRRLLVSAFLAASIQHIHSLRASGVISSHAVKACGSDVSAFLKSAGTSCTTPVEILLGDIAQINPAWLSRAVVRRGIHRHERAVKSVN